LTSAELQPADQALVLVQASYGRTFSGDFPGGETTARRALAVGESSGDRAMIVWALGAVSVPVRIRGRYGEALTLARRAVDLAFSPVDREARLRYPHFFLAMALCDADRIDEARLAYAHAIDESQELGSAWLLPDMLLLAAELRFLVGEWDDAATEFEAGLQLAQQHGQRISLAQTKGYQAVIATARGRLREAKATLADVEREVTLDPPCYGAEVVAFAQSVLAEARGHPADAFAVLLRCWERDAAREIRYYHRFLAPALTRLGTLLARRDVVREVVAVVEAGAALAPEVVTVQSVAARCRGLLDGDPAAVLRAVDLARRGPRLLDQAGACEDAAAILAACGRRAEAAELLLEAQTRYGVVGATTWQARVNAALRGLGVRQGARGRRRRPDSGWDSLTPGERAVSELVSDGLTNRDIGRRLHISPHTVNTHLRHVFQKLSISTRAELAGAVARAAMEAESASRDRVMFTSR
jgi:DNA-binding CsgD family transcriptional regulator